MLENVYEGLNARSEVYLSKDSFAASFELTQRMNNLIKHI